MKTIDISKDRKDKIMERRYRDFYERWSPSGYQASEFAAELHVLIQTVYEEAAEPANRRLMEIAGAFLISLQVNK